MQIYRKIISEYEIKHILNLIKEMCPECFTSTQNNKKIFKNLEFLKLIPKMYIQDLKGKCTELVLLSTIKNEKNYAGCDWHIDEDGENITILLYLQGDPEFGGEFCTEFEKHKFEVGTFFKLPSNLIHKVEPYNGTPTRIALKWKFK